MFFGENDQWCSDKYPWGQAVDQAAGDKLWDQYQKCTKSGVFSPWTIAGRLERGLLDDAQITPLVKAIAGTGGSKTPPPAAKPGLFPMAQQANVLTYGLIGVGVLGAAFMLLGGKRGRRRR